MGSGEWRQEYEDHAGGERAKLDRLSVRDLTARIRAGRLDAYHQTWYALAEKANLAEVGWLLFSFLESDEEYLPRYHCAAALLRSDTGGGPVGSGSPFRRVGQGEEPAAGRGGANGTHRPAPVTPRLALTISGEFATLP